MALKVKVGLFGLLDMLKFKNMAKIRERKIQKTKAKEICGTFKINENAKTLHPDILNLEISEILEHKNAGAKTFIFEDVNKNPLPYFRAGQYLCVNSEINGEYISRPYSICSSPKLALEGKLAITIKKTPENADGFAANYFLENWKPGTKITASSPQGQFFYEKMRDGQNVLALAGGSGITPFLSMAYAIRDGIENFNLTILFGSRNKKNILFYDELNEITKATRKVKVVHVLSDENADSSSDSTADENSGSNSDVNSENFEKGFITADLIKKYATADDFSIFVCGPKGMYDFIDKELLKLNLPQRKIRKEISGAIKNVSSFKEFPEDAKGKVFKISIKQGNKNTVIEAKSEESILVSLERAKIKSQSRCRSGECGWCRTKLLSGNVFIPQQNDGRRFSDKEFNYLHICASFPLSNLEIEVSPEQI